MFTVIFKTSVDLMDVQFREKLIEILNERQSGLVINIFDNCIFQLENVMGYENEDGDLVEVFPPTP